jgi:hypothetical protein
MKQLNPKDPDDFLEIIDVMNLFELDLMFISQISIIKHSSFEEVHYEIEMNINQN